MSKKKKYFPNNWRAIKDAPDDAFTSPHGPLLFKDFMDWKMCYELQSSVACLIRETNLTTGKVKEYSYSRHGDAQNKVNSIMEKGESEFIVCDDEELAYLHPAIYQDDDDSTV